MTRNPLALCYISRIRCGGKHPPKVIFMGKTLCRAWLAPAWEGAPRSITAKGAYGIVTEELFVLTVVALQPVP